jgi:hypothetical protein
MEAAERPPIPPEGADAEVAEVEAEEVEPLPGEREQERPNDEFDVAVDGVVEAEGEQT